MCQGGFNNSESYEDNNIASILKKIDTEVETGNKPEKVYTMVQVNSPCEVNITDKSREILADILMN